MTFTHSFSEIPELSTRPSQILLLPCDKIKKAECRELALTMSFLGKLENFDRVWPLLKVSTNLSYHLKQLNALRCFIAEVTIRRRKKSEKSKQFSYCRRVTDTLLISSICFSFPFLQLCFLRVIRFPKQKVSFQAVFLSEAVCFFSFEICWSMFGTAATSAGCRLHIESRFVVQISQPVFPYLWGQRFVTRFFYKRIKHWLAHWLITASCCISKAFSYNCFKL